MKIDVVRKEFRGRDLKWDGRELRLKTGRLLATVEPDGTWVGMFRVRLPNNRLTDIVNLTRAKDAAVCLALADLNHAASPAGPVYVRPNSGGVG